MNTTYNFNSELDRKAAVADYLSTKSLTNSYVVTYRRYFYKDGDSDDYTPEYFKEFTDEQIVLIQELLALQKEEGEELWAYLEDEETAKKYSFLQQEVDGYGMWGLEPESIDLDTVYHRYGFKLAIFYRGMEVQPTISDVRIDFSDEEYAELLEWKVSNPHSGFNFLRTSKPEFFKRLCDRFDNCFTSGDYIPFYVPSYAVEMTEIDEDAKKIMEKYFPKK